MAASAPAIRIRNLARRFGNTEAVRGLSLDIGAGELFGLLGPNGAGKTTTLSMLATLLQPSAGDADVLGQSLRERPTRVRRLVGLAPQELSLYEGLSGAGNVRFFGRLYGLRGAELEAACMRVLDLVGLRDRAGDRAGTYSGGMKRRLNLACGLVHAPRILLLDEPTAGVDPQSRDKLLMTVRDVAAGGTTVIYTTHYMEEAQRLCDRLAIMDQGEILAEGSLADMLRIVGDGEMIELAGEALEIPPERLAGIPGLLSTQATDGGLRLFVERAADAMGPLAGVLAALGHRVDSVEMHPVDLETVFMRLTGRALRD